MTDSRVKHYAPGCSLKRCKGLHINEVMKRRPRSAKFYICDHCKLVIRRAGNNAKTKAYLIYYRSPARDTALIRSTLCGIW